MQATLPRGSSVADIAAAFGVVFLAELGDKTQLVALTLAGRYPAVKVLAALGAAIALLQTLSVTAGALISEAVPDDAIAIGAGLLFLGFAVWTWRSSDEEEDDDVARALLGAQPPEGGVGDPGHRREHDGGVDAQGPQGQRVGQSGHGGHCRRPGRPTQTVSARRPRTGRPPCRPAGHRASRRRHAPSTPGGPARSR